MPKLVVVPPSGDITTVEVKKLHFSDLYRLMGCEMVERVKVRWCGKLYDAYCDEEALIKQIIPPANPRITTALDGPFKGYEGQIHGTVVIWVPGAI